MSKRNVFESNQYLIDLPLFQGPLDLLLYLIRQDEIDIYDIPIAKITKKYLEYIDLMKDLNIEVAGEYVLMAASLIRMKASLLLPRDEEEMNEPDPRHELMMALIEYRKFKEAGEILRDKAIIEEGKFVPPSPLHDMKVRTDLSSDTTLIDLLTAFKDLLDSEEEDASHEVAKEEVSVEERIEHIFAYLNDREFATFTELFADMPRKIMAVVTFIALLEMVRLRRVMLLQSRLFGELRVYRGENFEERGKVIEQELETVPLARETVES